MGNQMLLDYDNRHSEELFCPPVRWFGADDNILTVDDQFGFKKELEQLYQEALEYDFLAGKTPQAMPDYWEEEVE